MQGTLDGLLAAQRGLSDRFDDFRKALDRRDEAAYRLALADFHTCLRRWTEAEERTVLPALLRGGLAGRDPQRELRLEWIQVRELTRYLLSQLSEHAPLSDVLGFTENLARRVRNLPYWKRRPLPYLYGLGTVETFKGAFTLSSPLKVEAAGALAQGSVNSVHARGLDFQTPFDTTSTGEMLFWRISRASSAAGMKHSSVSLGSGLSGLCGNSRLFIRLPLRGCRLASLNHTRANPVVLPNCCKPCAQNACRTPDQDRRFPCVRPL